MKKALSVLGLTITVVLLGAAACDPVSGGACSPIGKKVTDSKGQVWTCDKNRQTGKGYWYKGDTNPPK